VTRRSGSFRDPTERSATSEFILRQLDAVLDSRERTGRAGRRSSSARPTKVSVPICWLSPPGDAVAVTAAAERPPPANTAVPRRCARAASTATTAASATSALLPWSSPVKSRPDWFRSSELLNHGLDAAECRAGLFDVAARIDKRVPQIAVASGG
jgi:hypothetical protein